MKKKEIFIVALLIVFGFVYNAVDKGKIKFAEDFSRYWDERRLVSEQYEELAQAEKVFPAPGKITLTNPAGEIRIDRSDDGQVHLLSFFRIYYKDREEIKKTSRQAAIHAEVVNDELAISGNYSSAFPYKHLRFRFELLVPAGVVLAVHNSEGNVSIRNAGREIFLRQTNGHVVLADIPSSAEMEVRGGNLDIRNVAGNVVINAQRSDIHLENARALNVSGKHGNFSLQGIKTTVFIEHAYGAVTLDGAEQAEISGRHSKIEVRNVKNGVRLGNAFQSIVLERIDGDVHLSNRSGRMDIRHVNARNMVIENSFADMAITDFTGENLNIIFKNGNLTLTGSRILDRLNIETKQANIDLTLGEMHDPSVNIKTVHGRITNQSPLDLEIFRERKESFGNRSGQKPEIIINNSYGDIHLK